MGKISHVIVESTTELLQLLGLDHSDIYQTEFVHLIEDDLVCFDEDWSTEPELLEVLYCHVRNIRPHTIVEIGTFRGTSSIIFATALEHNRYGHLYTIDNNETGVLKEAQAKFLNRRLEHRITSIEKSSHNAFVDWGRAKIDLLYIDGSHSFLDTCSDFALWSRYVVKNGLIVIHDTVTRLMRRFPEDYIYPLSYYNILNITDVRMRPSGQEWEGCGFITIATEAPVENKP